jgi:activating signal cointegrator complex subunit 2
VEFLAYTTACQKNVEILEIMNKDLEWLLELSHADFWNQVIFDRSLHQFLDSYLQLAPRTVTHSSSLATKMMHKNVFLIYLRMSTHKESVQDTISRDVFGEIVYDNFLFDMPKIFDLCCLYGSSNQPLLSKMVSNIFKCQPKYYEDLKTTITGTLQALERTIDEVNSIGQSASSSSADKIEDVIFFLSDSGKTVKYFLGVFPEAAILFWEGGAVVRFLHFYEEVMPTVQHLWKGSSLRDPQTKEVLRGVKHSWVDVVYSLVVECLVKSKQAQTHELVVSFLTNLLSHPNFLRQFQRQYDMFKLVAMVTETQHLDETSKEYLDEVVKSSLKQVKREKESKEVSKSTSEVAQQNSLSPEVAAVKEVLPHLHDDFISSCLKQYDTSSAVIAAVLEGEVTPTPHSTGPPQAVQERSEKLSAADKGVTMETPLLDSRQSIFDNDEFDFFRRRNVDTSRIRKGKKVLSAAILDEKMADLKVRIVENYDVEIDEYEDEYDDTYDSLPISVAETAKGDYFNKLDESEDEDDEDEEVDPAVDPHQRASPRPSQELQHGGVKQRTQHQEYEHAKRGSGARRGRGRGRGGPASANELKQRNWKEKHKSFTSNHNRKVQAHKKQQKGMF